MTGRDTLEAQLFPLHMFLTLIIKLWGVLLRSTFEELRFDLTDKPQGNLIRQEHTRTRNHYFTLKHVSVLSFQTSGFQLIQV